MLAQIQNVDAGVLKQVLMIAITAITVGATVAGLMRRKRTIEPQPLEVREAEKYATADQCLARHAEAIRRLDDHCHQIESLWTTVRDENTSIRMQLSTFSKDVERSLGRIEGKVDTIVHKR